VVTNYGVIAIPDTSGDSDDIDGYSDDIGVIVMILG
jgi:hypothetical protein